ncbi:hypothetical protein BN1708_019679, partial [Verticillium longisporum]
RVREERRGRRLSHRREAQRCIAGGTAALREDTPKPTGPDTRRTLDPA